MPSVLPKLVASVTEMASRAHRHKLVYGIWSGLAIAAAFGLVARAPADDAG